MRLLVAVFARSAGSVALSAWMLVKVSRISRPGAWVVNDAAVPLPTARKHYVVRRGDRLVKNAEYEGSDSDAAVAMWAKIESDPVRYPGPYEFWEDGRCRGKCYGRRT